MLVSPHTTSGETSPRISFSPHYSSLSSSSSSSSFSLAAFFAGFFLFFLLLLLLPVDFANGCSRIFRTSSSVIFLSVLYLARSGAGGALSRVRPFFVIATQRSDQ